MQVLTKTEAKLRKEELKEKIKKGNIFIHPTDTIYGLGCSALNSAAIKKLRQIKQRPDTPFSVIAPSKNWIKNNCKLSKDAEKWIEKLPGPYTLILKTKNSPVAKEVAPNKDSIGIRIPNHWISEIVKELGIPIITTSVNTTDEPYMTKIEDLDLDINEEIRHKLAFVFRREMCL